jgi:hypothetical protein
MKINKNQALLTMMAVLMIIYFGIGIAVGDTPTPTWAPRISCPPNATIATPNMTLYNQSIGDLFGYGDLGNVSLNNFMGDVIMPFLNVYGIFFWGAFFGTIAVVMFAVQEDVRIPIALTLLGGAPIVLWQLPYDWQKAVGTFVILGIAAIMYAARKKRGY